MAFETAGAAEVFLLGRVLFGGILAFMGLNHFLNGDQMIPYAEMKGLPAPALSVYFSGVCWRSAASCSSWVRIRCSRPVRSRPSSSGRP